MKVLILCNYPIYNFQSYLEINQSITRITSWNENLVNALAKNEELEIFVVSINKFIRYDTNFHLDGVTYHFIKLSKSLTATTLYCNLILKIQHLIKNIQPDIIHGIGTEHIYPFIAVTSKYPNIITIHGVISEILKVRNISLISHHRFFAILEKYSIYKAKNIIAINPYVYSVIKSNRSVNFFNIENCVNPLFFNIPKNINKIYDILMIGDFLRGKGHIDLLKSILIVKTKIENINVAFIGALNDSRIVQEVHGFIQQHDLEKNVTIYGFKLPQDVSKILYSSKMLVLPSYQETAPMCIAESMACSVPILATDVGGIPNMVSNGNNGFLFKPGDVCKLATLIERLLSDQIILNNISKNSRTYALQKYSPEKVSYQTFNAYNQVLTTKLHA